MNSTIETKMNYQDFPITVGVMIRLTPEQKQSIKEAYEAAFFAETQSQDRQDVGGVTVATAATARQLTNALGMDRLVLSSVLGSSERVTIGMCKRFEKALGVKILDKKQLETTWKSYLDHVFSKETD